ncbi:MAG: AtpZ/AtpI family protein [Polyangiaceae bacterium]
MSAWKGIGRYGTVGFDLLFSMGVGFYGGRYLDTHYFGGKGWGTIVGTLLGIAAGFRNLFRAAKMMERETEREDREGTGVPYSKEYLEVIDRDAALEKEKREKKEKEQEKEGPPAKGDKS